MANGVVNIGLFRDLVILNYFAGETTTDMGSAETVLIPVQTNADVEQLDLKTATDLGMNLQNINYRVTCRDMKRGRVYSVIFRGETYQVFNQHSDKLLKFVQLLITRKE